MHVGVAYADKFKQMWLTLDVPDGCSIREAIEHSGILLHFPDLDIEAQPVGVFGKISKLDSKLQDGERVEIYRHITADPETVERRDIEED